ncbi:zinc finger protein RFP-like isoform X2 [Erythrolamprus reginae]|uniref:zinc finger protein RFP-like isoform X2 n=1 Tax=Erythrolamprus reginae TaxID=121349 RepID=UPI00396C50DB
MSTEKLTRRLKGELICFICLDSFHDPVSIHCGHTFCQACITTHWIFNNREFFHCPKCSATSRKRILKPNRELGNIARIVPKLDKKNKGKEKTKEKMCQVHGEPLKLFCKSDQMAICVVCDKSKEHKDHTVYPVEQEIQDQLIFLKTKREKLVKFQAMNAARSKEALNTIDAGIQKTLLAFKQAYQSLEEQKQLVLAEWHSLQTAVEDQEIHNDTIAEEISRLDSLITRAEERQPTLELEEIQTTSMRLKQKMFQGFDDLLPEMEKQLAYQTRQNEVVLRTLQQCKDVLKSVRKKEDSSSPAAKKWNWEDQADNDAFDYSPESRLHSSSSQQSDKKSPVGDNVPTFIRKKEDSSFFIAKKRKQEGETADDAFDYSPESRLHSSSSQQSPVGNSNVEKCQKPSQCLLS